MAAPAARPDSNPLFSDAAACLLSTSCLLELITKFSTSTLHTDSEPFSSMYA